MPKISEKPLTRVCIRVWKEDYDKLREVSEASNDIGVNLLIREIVHNYVKNLRDRERQNLDRLGRYQEPDAVILDGISLDKTAAE